jgi:signal transduction protein with GAF and PtsI domain
MTEIKELKPVVEACNHLMDEIDCEFVGLAIQNKIGPDIRWHYAFGNLNDKYKRITVRYGKGIAGKIISSGSPMMIQDFPNHILGKSIDYPIMLGEKLISSYGVPLFFNAVPKGVLVIGKRTNYTFLDHECEKVKDAALLLEKLLKDYIYL